MRMYGMGGGDICSSYELNAVKNNLLNLGQNWNSLKQLGFFFLLL